MCLQLWISLGKLSSFSATKPGKSSEQQPKPKKRDHGFKTTADGKLIIADGSSESEDEDKPKRKRNAVTSDSGIFCGFKNYLFSRKSSIL